MEYMVVNREGADAIKSAVNDLIAEGWRPQGGVFVIREPNPYDRHQTDTEYYQAMIREGATTPDTLAFANLVAAVMKQGFDFEQALRIVELTKGGE